MECNYVKCGDCLTLMKKLDNNSVDVVFTSPPYNDHGSDKEDVQNNKHKHKKYLYTEHREDWFEWQCECIDEMLRISKKWVLYNIQAISSNRANVYKIIGKYSDRIHDVIIWDKPNGCPTSTPNAITNTYEFLILLKCEGTDRVYTQSKFFRNVISLPVNKNKEFNKIHRAVMSKDFCDIVIHKFTSPKDIVLDPFFGLGTTWVSCIEQDRKYIGFEISQEYIDIANKRLKLATKTRKAKLF